MTSDSRIRGEKVDSKNVGSASFRTTHISRSSPRSGQGGESPEARLVALPMRVPRGSCLFCGNGDLGAPSVRMGILRLMGRISPENLQTNSCWRSKLASFGRSIVAYLFPSYQKLPSKHKRGTVQHEENRAARAKAKQLREKAGRPLERPMSITALKPSQKTFTTLTVPKSGKAKLFLEASAPVDVFVSLPDKAPAIKSVSDAGAGVLVLSGRTNIDTVITFPDAWRTLGWSLVVGNPSTTDVAAVYFAIFEA